MGPAADGTYTTTFDYYVAPEEMTADSDVPSCPKQYFMAIVYRAMIDYAAFEGAGELYMHGVRELGIIVEQMEADRMPDIEVAGALA